MNEEQYEPEELPGEFFENLLSGEQGKNAGGKKRKIKVNFENSSAEYANFCTLSTRSGEIFLGFGQASPFSKEVKIQNHIVMGLNNAAKLHALLGKALRQQQEKKGPDRNE